MTPERWQRIESLYHSALGLEPEKRSVFLVKACQGDEDLRREVESLLSQPSSLLIEDSTRTALPAGMELGPYQIESPLGAGGMGQVYKARDRRLGRAVAIKILSERFSDRFEREARAISSLNHPHICTLHDVGPNYLVMELVEGETLAARLTKGALQVAQVLDYGAQIADALAAAHAKGITHRDLKPGNIMLTKSGVKVLDFGLAKSNQDETLTGSQVVMGTPAYMAPEQREGKECDARTDIYALGLILREMATGERTLRPGVDLPAELSRVVLSCLEVNPEERWQSARDLRQSIEWSVAGATVPGSARRPWLAWAVAAALAVGLAAVAFLHFREKAPGPNAFPEIALSIVPPSGNLVPIGQLAVDRISPDGSTVLYFTTGLHIRRLGSLQDQAMPPLGLYGIPFWAPDSKSIAVPTLSGLMKVQVPHGAPEMVTAHGVERGGSWGDKGIVLFAGFDSSPGRIGLYGVPVSGGNAFPIEVPGLKAGRYYNPEFLPGGDDFLFLFAPLDSAGAQVFIATLHGGKAINPRLLFSNDTAAAFTSAGGGRILFVRDDNLYAQKLDVRARHLIGNPELVQERVASYTDIRVAYFSVSNDGTVAWRSGTALTSQVAVFDRKGNRIGTAGASVPAQFISLAPDEAHILVSSSAGSWVMESNGPGGTSLGSLPQIQWSPDGSGTIGFRGAEIVQRSLTGAHEIRSLEGLPAMGGGLPLLDISVDGRRILYNDGASLLSFSLDGERRSERVVEQLVNQAAISPDGAWTVYHAATDQALYVQPLTSHGLRRQIANRATSEVWRKDGKEIVYRTFESENQTRIWSVRVDGMGAQLRFAPPEALFSVSSPLGLTGGARPLAVSRDGSKIYFLQSVAEPDSGVIQVRTHAIR